MITRKSAFGLGMLIGGVILLAAAGILFWNNEKVVQSASSNEKMTNRADALADHAAEIHSVPDPEQYLKHINLISNTTHSGTGGYTDTFSVSKHNGDQITISIQNNNRAALLFKVSQNEHDFGFVKVSPEAKLTRTFQLANDAAADYFTDWKVYVVSEIGAQINLTANASQFSRRD